VPEIKIMKSLIEKVLSNALSELETQGFELYTLALYHDHESGTISVCADTAQNSDRVVFSINRNNLEYFTKCIANSDLKQASLWQCNIGRNLSLGDFAAINLAREDLPGDLDDTDLYLAMVQGLTIVQERALKIAPQKERLAFASSGADSEVQYVWAPYNGT
jgi:hypothetical protein